MPIFGPLMPDYAEGFTAGGGGGGGGDVDPPTIAIVSPTPGVAPGAPGGFSANPVTARATPVVAVVSDAVHVALVVVDMVASGVRSPVYRTDVGFVLPFRGTATMLGADLTLTVTHGGGWPYGGFRLDVRASDGNVSA